MDGEREEEMWTDGSVDKDGVFAGCAFTYRQEDGRWAGQSFVIRGAGRDVDLTELTGIRNALTFLAASVRRVSPGGALPAPRRVLIRSDSRNALDEIYLRRYGGADWCKTRWVTSVTHPELCQEIQDAESDLGRLGVTVRLEWEKAKSSDGGEVVDSKANSAMRMSMRQAGMGRRVESVVFQNEEFDPEVHRN